jgi:hypothetical protein
MHSGSLAAVLKRINSFLIGEACQKCSKFFDAIATKTAGGCVERTENEGEAFEPLHQSKPVTSLDLAPLEGE